MYIVSKLSPWQVLSSAQLPHALRHHLWEHLRCCPPGIKQRASGMITKLRGGIDVGPSWWFPASASAHIAICSRMSLPSMLNCQSVDWWLWEAQVDSVWCGFRHSFSQSIEVFDQTAMHSDVLLCCVSRVQSVPSWPHSPLEFERWHSSSSWCPSGSTWWKSLHTRHSKPHITGDPTGIHWDPGAPTRTGEWTARCWWRPCELWVATSRLPLMPQKRHHGRLKGHIEVGMPFVDHKKYAILV